MYLIWRVSYVTIKINWKKKTRVRSWTGPALDQPLWPRSSEGQGQVHEKNPGPGPDWTLDSLHGQNGIDEIYEIYQVINSTRSNHMITWNCTDHKGFLKRRCMWTTYRKCKCMHETWPHFHQRMTLFTSFTTVIYGDINGCLSKMCYWKLRGKRGTACSSFPIDVR